jgi:hypothetical protein
MLRKLKKEAHRHIGFGRDAIVQRRLGLPETVVGFTLRCSVRRGLR